MPGAGAKGIRQNRPQRGLPENGPPCQIPAPRENRTGAGVDTARRIARDLHVSEGMRQFAQDSLVERGGFEPSRTFISGVAFQLDGRTAARPVLGRLHHPSSRRPMSGWWLAQATSRDRNSASRGSVEDSNSTGTRGRRCPKVFCAWPLRGSAVLPSSAAPTAMFRRDAGSRCSRQSCCRPRARSSL